MTPQEHAQTDVALLASARSGLDVRWTQSTAVHCCFSADLLQVFKVSPLFIDEGPESVSAGPNAGSQCTLWETECWASG